VPYDAALDLFYSETDPRCMRRQTTELWYDGSYQHLDYVPNTLINGEPFEAGMPASAPD
jgi:hypothetical protein